MKRKSLTEMVIEATRVATVDLCMETISKLPSTPAQEAFKRICLEELGKLKTGDER